MSDNVEIMRNCDYENAAPLLSKWLKFLFLTQIMNVAVSVAGAIGVPSGITGVVSIVLTGCLLYAMFQLSAVNERYRKAFVFGVVQLAASICSRLFSSDGFSLVISICSLCAVYQQYHGHAEVTSNLDEVLSGKWGRLFTWELVVGIITVFGTIAATVVGIGMGSALEALIGIVLLLAVIPGIALEVLYLVYLKRTLALFAEK